MTLIERGYNVIHPVGCSEPLSALSNPQPTKRARLSLHNIDRSNRRAIVVCFLSLFLV